MLNNNNKIKISDPKNSRRYLYELTRIEIMKKNLQQHNIIFGYLFCVKYQFPLLRTRQSLPGIILGLYVYVYFIYTYIICFFSDTLSSFISGLVVQCPNKMITLIVLCARSITRMTPGMPAVLSFYILCIL